MKNTNEMNGKYLISILADVSNNTLYIPKAIKEKSRYLASPEATLYFEYKNRYQFPTTLSLQARVLRLL